MVELGPTSREERYDNSALRRRLGSGRQLRSPAWPTEDRKMWLLEVERGP